MCTGTGTIFAEIVIITMLLVAMMRVVIGV